MSVWDHCHLEPGGSNVPNSSKQVFISEARYFQFQVLLQSQMKWWKGYWSVTPPAVASSAFFCRQICLPGTFSRADSAEVTPVLGCAEGSHLLESMSWSTSDSFWLLPLVLVLLPIVSCDLFFFVFLKQNWSQQRAPWDGTRSNIKTEVTS